MTVLNAEVVKLVDTLASGASGGNPVEVQVLSSAPTFFLPQAENKGGLPTITAADVSSEAKRREPPDGAGSPAGISPLLGTNFFSAPGRK